MLYSYMKLGAIEDQQKWPQQHSDKVNNSSLAPQEELVMHTMALQTLSQLLWPERVM